MLSTLRSKIEQADTSLFGFKDHRVTEGTQITLMIHPPNAIPSKYRDDLAWEQLPYNPHILNMLLDSKIQKHYIEKAITQTEPFIVISRVIDLTSSNKIHSHIYTWYKGKVIVICYNDIFVIDKNILRQHEEPDYDENDDRGDDYDENDCYDENEESIF